MSFEIKKATLGDFLNFKNGKKSPERADNASFPVFGSNGLIGRAELTNCPENTIVIGRVGSYCGSVHFSKEKCWVSDNAISCSSKSTGEEHFWFYVLTKLNLNQFNSGSGQPLLNQATLNAVECEVPNNSSIRALIGDVLNDYDKKIKLNAATNETLEEMAQAIFKSWFVDFDPVKAKMNGEQPEGMDAATASLFPEKLVESELGLIPEGWDINYIKDFGKVVTGKTPPKKVEDAYAEEGVPFVTPSDIDSDVFVSETKRFLSESGVEAVKKSLLPEGSICVTCIGSQMGKAVISPSEAISNQQINSIVVSKDYVRNFLFLNLRRRREEIFLIGSSGSTMPIINKSTFEKLAVLTPSEELMRSFDRSVSSLLSKIHQNAIENQTLSSLRDTLLPKLLSGEIELAEISKTIK